MQYFDQSDDTYERIGKVIGDAITACVVLTFLAVFAFSLLGR